MYFTKKKVLQYLGFCFGDLYEIYWVQFVSDAPLPHTDVFINFQLSQSADSVSLDEHLMTDIILFFFFFFA